MSFNKCNGALSEHAFLIAIHQNFEEFVVTIFSKKADFTHSCIGFSLLFVYSASFASKNCAFLVQECSLSSGSTLWPEWIKVASICITSSYASYMYYSNNDQGTLC